MAAGAKPPVHAHEFAAPLRILVGFYFLPSAERLCYRYRQQHPQKLGHNLEGRETMNAHRILCLVLVLCFVEPVTAWTQADSGNIVGIVQDTSGAVLPGVAVEAASSALI